MRRTLVRKVGQESVSLQDVVLWCSSCNGLMGEMVRGAWETNYFRYYKRLGSIASTASDNPSLEVSGRAPRHHCVGNAWASDQADQALRGVCCFRFFSLLG